MKYLARMELAVVLGVRVKVDRQKTGPVVRVVRIGLRWLVFEKRWRRGKLGGAEGLLLAKSLPLLPVHLVLHRRCLAEVAAVARNFGWPWSMGRCWPRWSRIFSPTTKGSWSGARAA